VALAAAAAIALETLSSARLASEISSSPQSSPTRTRTSRPRRSRSRSRTPMRPSRKPHRR